ncbi:MAG: UDP-N-acetylmuramoyl-L-alanine--D-glutamate ligase [Patescibacteria group bacterium]|jgi:UDP-N-acetylmuramoylalanine--D-glutamate ligase
MLPYAGKKVVIMGLGRMAKGSGVSAALFFARAKAKVVVTDSRPSSLLNKESIAKLKKFKNVQLVLGRHRMEDFVSADIVIKNPAVKPNSSYLHAATDNCALILTDLGLFFDYIHGKNIKVIGITGTRGKSTTTTLIYEILKAKYKNKVYLGGNIGNSPLNFMEKLKEGDLVVMEVASFQLHDLYNHHFNTAVITNILPDHLDYYKNMAQYQKDKENIFNTQTESDYLVLNKADKKVKAIAAKAKSKIVFYADSHKVKLSEIQILGKHNLSNIAAAWTVGNIYKVPDGIIKKVVKEFKGVESRLELIREYKGVKFYNDTTSTHPKATVVALQAFPKKKIILISGGNTKNLPLNEMSREIKRSARDLILVPGNANGGLPKGINVKNIQEAVKKAWHLAKKGDVILFSPGLTWLPAINEFKRGDVFTELVRRIA